MPENAPIFPIVMCGGSGSRLWPVSRQRLPKQFLPIIGAKPLLDATLERIAAGEAAFAPAILISARDHEFLVRRAVADSGLENTSGIFEPVGRGTAAAVWAAATRALELAGDPLILIMPADHHIPDTTAFAQTIQRGRRAAEAGQWVTFGITPDSPATGYGYIEAGEEIDTDSRMVKRFVEKPGIASAEAMLAAGGFYWNAGIFLVRAKTALASLQKHAPAIANAMSAVWNGSVRRDGSVFLDSELMAMVPASSIDYAVMEHEHAAAVVPFSGPWSDVGSWAAVAALSVTDENGNAIVGNAQLLDTQDTFVRAGKRLVTAVGVSDLIVIDSDDATLICHRKDSERIKELLDGLSPDNAAKAQEHMFEQRPWGMFERIYSGSGYQVKCLEVAPGGRLSLQFHHHRSEHWVVVQGTPTVTVDGRVQVFQPGHSIDIPLGAVHRLENFGDEPVQIIEIQRGNYLGEDDIVRVEDTYDR